MARIKIQLFGGINPGLEGGADCQGCGPVSAGVREHEVLREILSDMFGEGELELEYIETMDQDLAAFPALEQPLQLGHRFPMVMINGVMRWTGSMPLGAIIEAVKAGAAD